MKIKIKMKAISWLGVKTDKFDEMANFYENVMGLPIKHQDDGFRAYSLPNKDMIELFDINNPEHEHFTTGPVAGFLVDDIEIAKKEMEENGVEFIGDIDGDPNRSKWAHFRGPDGNIYELKWHHENY